MVFESFVDYVGFIKKLMKLMQHRYPSISRLEIELRQLESVAPPTRPCEFISTQYPLYAVN